MRFNSWMFWLFFAVVLGLYWCLPHRRQNRLLLVAGYVLYGLWDYHYLFLILLSTTIDFIGGLGIAGVHLTKRRLIYLGALLLVAAVLFCTPINYGTLWESIVAGNRSEFMASLPCSFRDFGIVLGVGLAMAFYGLLLPSIYNLSDAARRRIFLGISICANLSLLGFFKYCDFFIGSMGNLLHSLGIHFSPTTLGLIVPAGISFYTFQAMSYTIDVFRGVVEPTEDFLDFALFVSFFPHLIAGPIMRAHSLLPQVERARSITASAAVDGLYLVVIGLFKKLVVADNLAPFVSLVFDQFSQGQSPKPTGIEVLVATYAFAAQIYCDFSGYSSIARGISKWLGFELVVNFNNPYLAINPSDFWQRWHISLSTWLRDYLYVVLGGNRLGWLITVRNLMMTMILGGLWHGANWTFIIWGLYHGIILCLYRLVPLRVPSSIIRWIMVVIMFHITCLGWLIFRADSIAAIEGMLHSLLWDWRMAPLVPVGLSLLAFFAGGMFVWESWLGAEARVDRLGRQPWLLQSAQLAYMLVMLVIFTPETTHEFIYFQF